MGRIDRRDSTRIAHIGARLLDEAGGVGTLDDIIQALDRPCDVNGLEREDAPAVKLPKRVSMRRYLTAAVQHRMVRVYPADATPSRGRPEPVYLLVARASAVAAPVKAPA